MSDRLNGYRVLILETRAEAQFSRLLADQGADVVQCPMFAIHDAPNPAPVEAWIRRYIDKPFDDLVVMTGEGLRRLMKLARERGLDQPFVAALAKSRKFIRGPKPGQALREIGLEPQQITEKPTTDGVIETLAMLDLKGRRLALQLYPDKDHSTLINAITAQGAEVDHVLPYVHDANATTANIIAAIEDLVEGRIDAVAFTNLGQVRRFVEAAKANGREASLREGLARTLIASVGPAVSGELHAHGLRTDISPAEGAYFMRPLVAAVAVALADKKPKMGVK